MKVVLTIALLLFNACAFAAAAVDAPQLYNDGQYAAAAAAYERQTQQEPQNPYAYYNLANSYFKTGDIDKAIVNYYRAFKLLPRDKDIKNNLAFALSSTGQQFYPAGAPRIIFSFYYLFSSVELWGLTIVFAWLCAALFVLLKLGAKHKIIKRLFYFSLSGLIIFALWYGVRYPQNARRIGVISVSRAEVRSGPGQTFPVVISVPRSHLITLSDTKDDWVQITVNQDGSQGWILKKNMEEI